MIVQFIEAFSILLREGLEALLVLSSIAVYLKRADIRDYHGRLATGIALAVGMSLAASWALHRFDSDIEETAFTGVVVLLAAIAMLYVSGWLYLRRDEGSWVGYLQRKTGASLHRHMSLGIVLVAFIAVLREGLETVLFLHALSRTADGWSIGMTAGLLAAAAILVVMALAISRAANSVPLRLVFLATSCVMFVMAMKFIGEAFELLQEAGVVSATVISGGDLLRMLGLNPTWEAVLVQAIFAAMAAGIIMGIDRQPYERRSPR